MRVKIKGIPKTQQGQDARITPFSNPFADTPHMAYGGAKPNQGTQNGVPLRSIDTRWDWMRDVNNRGYDNPYGSVNKTLPEVPAHMADINAEKDEMVMGNFTGDGMPTLMGVNGPSHAQGGKNLQVPDNAFVFSDTKNLTIKDPMLLRQFGATKPMTPAKLAKKYDLITYKSVIDDPQAEEIEKRTATMNYTNAVNKLNALSSAQEQLKARKGLPNDLPQQQDQVPVGMYGGYMQDGGYNFLTPKRKQELIDRGWDQKTPPGQWVSENFQGDALSALGNRPIPKDAVPGATDYLGERVYGDRWKGLNLNDLQRKTTDIQAMPTGQVPATDMPQDPFDPTQVPDLPAYQDVYPSAQVGDAVKGTARGISSALGNPDIMRNYALGLRTMSYPNYQPTRQIAHGAVPQAVFLDPTRAKAAYTEQANLAANNAAISGNGPIARAMAAEASGKAGAGSANVEGEYAYKNAEIANRNNEQGAEIYNRVQAQQQGYNKDYNEEVANTLKDRYGFNTAISNEYLKGMYEDRDRAVKQAWLNKTSPYFGVDNQGFPVFKNKEAEGKFWRTMDGNPEGGSGFDQKLAIAKGYREKYLAAGYSPEYADRESARHAGLSEHETRSYDPYNPIHQKIRQSGIPVEKYGGKTKVRITHIP